MIVELCGLPGTGKSTLADDISKKIGVKNRTSLLQLDHMLNFKWKVVKHSSKDWILTEEEKKLYRLSCEYTNHDSLYIYRLLNIYRSIKKHNIKDVYILEEGPIQYLSSIAYDTNLVETALLNQAVNIMTKHERVVILCECPMDIIVSRIRNRHKKSDRYNFDDTAKMKKLLQLKKENIAFLLKHYNGSVYYLDMTKLVSDNLNRLIQILREEKVIT